MSYAIMYQYCYIVYMFNYKKTVTVYLITKHSYLYYLTNEVDVPYSIRLHLLLAFRNLIFLCL